MELNKEYFSQIVSESSTISQVRQRLDWPKGGTSSNKIKKLIEEYDICISHFGRKRKYDVIEKSCPVCDKKFKTKTGPSERKTCSYSCANRYTKTGENNGNWKDINDIANVNGKIKKICFQHHEHKCCVCGEEIAVAVHHYDENRKNNEPNNLIPICPNHHQYYHSNYRYLVKDKIEIYRKDWLEKWNSSADGQFASD